MTPKDIAVISLMSGLVTASWAYVLQYRHLPARLSSIIDRKPHKTRRGYTLRLLMYSIESMQLFAPWLTIALGAILLAMYVLDFEKWPILSIALFLGPGTIGMTIFVIKDGGLMRRAGLTCPACGGWVIGKSELQLLKTGRCQTCRNVLFRARGPKRVNR
jgi:hypothetical protein